MLVPIGPVAVFGASNFPLAFSTAGGDTASALAAGCPVIVKGHPSHPGTSAVVARELAGAAAERRACPSATFALLQSSGVEVGEALVDEPAIAAVGFTGSFAGGKALYDRAAARERPIPVYAEMGSVNPIVVTEAALTARSEAIAEGLAASVATFGGQLCTKPGVVFVPAGEAGDAFAADLGARLAGAEPQVLLNERLRDALTARRARSSAGWPSRGRRRRDAGRAGLPLPPRRLPRGGGRRARAPRAARGALRPRRAAADLRLARRAARRARCASTASSPARSTRRPRTPSSSRC